MITSDRSAITESWYVRKPSIIPRPGAQAERPTILVFHDFRDLGFFRTDLRIDLVALPEVVSGGTPGQMRITKINRELQVELHMSPVEFKVLAQWMARHVQQFEENFHEIQLGPQEASDEDNPLVQ